MTMGAFERAGADELVLPEFSLLGYNYRMSDIMAGIGRIQLKRLDEYIEKRNRLAKTYNDLIEDHSLAIVPQKVLPAAKHDYQTYAVRTESKKVRNNLVAELKKRGIGSTIGTYSLSQLPLFTGDAPNSKLIFEQTIALPMYHELSEEEVKIVINEIKDIIK
jgi:dTDP-4-amino-4,6-dideoxygalactose transaminase